MPEPRSAAEALAALGQGRFADWRGLPADCTPLDADAAFGPAAAGDGRPAPFRWYPSAPVAPHGVMVWLEGARVVLIQVNTPALKVAEIRKRAGEPEARDDSRIGSTYLQWIYSSRGLVFHVNRISGAVNRFYGFPASTLEEFRKSALYRVELRRKEMAP